MNHPFRMKHSFACLALASAFALPAFAQSTPAFEAFGAKPGLMKLNTDFAARLKADKRLAEAFKDTNLTRLAEQLTEQFCQVLGGPCAYKGADMKTLHSNMDITTGQFNALVEVLQEAMAAQGVPFSAQNTLLAKLAPMHRDIINK